MKKQYIIMNGFEFEENTYYNVEISMGGGNPIFQDIFYTGFLNGKDNGPGGYNSFFKSDGEIKDIYYMKVLSKIDTEIDNQYRMVKDVLLEQYPEKVIWELSI